MKSITTKLFFSILGATGLAIVSLFLVMQWSISWGFYKYLETMGRDRLAELTTDLGRNYAEHGNWDFLKTAPSHWGAGTFNGPPRHELEHPPFVRPERMENSQPPPVPPPFKPGPARGPYVILDVEKRIVLGSLPKDEEVNFNPIKVRGQIVGHIGLISPKHFLNPMQYHFLSQQRLAMALSAVSMVVIAAIVSLPLAMRLVQPIKVLAAATHDIASGNYATRIPVSSSDELGRLSHDFNEMALTLDKHEKERRQWVADISHELRTPVAVLRGEIEALMDGIRKVTPEAISSLHTETLRLNRLVEDLYQLSLSDIGALTYRKENLNLAEIIENCIEMYRAGFSLKDITITLNLPHDERIVVFADRARINQLFSNLLENSLHYTDSGGCLTVDVTSNNHTINIEIQDSAPGVSEYDLSRLFDRLYRVEESRSRASGGAGLGLAICKNIVEAHEGSIAAYSSSLGGLLIRIHFPYNGMPS